MDKTFSNAAAPAVESDCLTKLSSSRPTSATPNSPGRKNLRKADFDHIFQNGLREKSVSVRILAALGHGRTGFAASKKIGSKPRRNRGKRRLKEALRLQPELIQTGLDYVVIALESASLRTFADLKAEVKSAMEQLNQKWVERSASF